MDNVQGSFSAGGQDYEIHAVEGQANTFKATLGGVERTFTVQVNGEEWKAGNDNHMKSVAGTVKEMLEDRGVTNEQLFGAGAVENGEGTEAMSKLSLATTGKGKKIKAQTITAHAGDKTSQIYKKGKDSNAKVDAFTKSLFEKPRAEGGGEGPKIDDSLLKADFADLQAQVDNTKGELKGAQAELKELLAAGHDEDTLSSKLDELLEKCSGFDKANDSHSTELKDKMNTFNTEFNVQNEQDGLNKLQKKKLANLEKRFQKDKAPVSKGVSDNANLLTQLKADIASAQNQSALGSVGDPAQLLRDIQDNGSEISGALQKADGAMGRLPKEGLASEEQMNQLRDDLEGLKGLLAQLQGTQGTQSTSQSSLSESLEQTINDKGLENDKTAQGMQQNCGLAKEALNQNASSLEALQTKINNLEAKIGEAQGALEADAANRADADAALGEFERGFGGILEEAKNTNLEAENRAREAEGFEKDVMALMKEFADNPEGFDASTLESQLNSFDDRLANTTQRHVTASGNLDNAKGELENLAGNKSMDEGKIGQLRGQTEEADTHIKAGGENLTKAEETIKRARELIVKGNTAKAEAKGAREAQDAAAADAVKGFDYGDLGDRSSDTLKGLKAAAGDAEKASNNPNADNHDALLNAMNSSTTYAEEVNQQSTELASLKEQLANLKENHKGADTSVIEAKIEKMEGNINASKEQLASLNESIGTMQSNMTARSKGINDAFEGGYGDLKTKSGETLNKAKALNGSNLQQLLTDKQTAAQTLAKATAAVQANAVEVKELTAQTQATSAELREAQQDANNIDGAQARIEQLTTQLQSDKAKMKGLELALKNDFKPEDLQSRTQVGTNRDFSMDTKKAIYNGLRIHGASSPNALIEHVIRLPTGKAKNDEIDQLANVLHEGGYPSLAEAIEKEKTSPSKTPEEFVRKNYKRSDKFYDAQKLSQQIKSNTDSLRNLKAMSTPEGAKAAKDRLAALESKHAQLDNDLQVAKGKSQNLKSAATDAQTASKKADDAYSQAGQELRQDYSSLNSTYANQKQQFSSAKGNIESTAKKYDIKDNDPTLSKLKTEGGNINANLNEADRTLNNIEKMLSENGF